MTDLVAAKHSQDGVGSKHLAMVGIQNNCTKPAVPEGCAKRNIFLNHKPNSSISELAADLKRNSISAPRTD
jgi:hypothetical protein